MVERSPTALDLTYSALAHPIRREMIQFLEDGPLRVTDVAEPFRVSLAAASKHIRTLETAGLIARRVAGRDHLLSFRPMPLVEASEWIDTTRSFWDARLDALDAHLREGRRR
ncbi:MAG TPA: metalloregulator ArsR/SmtB family transcription factor [Actinomycetota bacterium]|jgi:DNA-binding transcriptional ArsR family regulator